MHRFRCGISARRDRRARRCKFAGAMRLAERMFTIVRRLRRHRLHRDDWPQPMGRRAAIRPPRPAARNGAEIVTARPLQISNALASAALLH
jgi:hypothetical protein